jgi:acyl transferase domain-containing protein/acyl carrier protein/ubiquinone/menaquinone biosynthesis C-methylase UbiE
MKEKSSSQNRIQVLEMIRDNRITLDEGLALLKQNGNDNVNENGNDGGKPGESPELMYFHHNWEEEPLDIKELQVRQWKNLVIFDTGEDIYSRLTQRLQETKITLVKPGEKFRKTGNTIYEVDPREPDHYNRLMDDLFQDTVGPLKMIHMWSGNNRRFTGNEHLLKTQLEKSLYSVFYLSQALMAQKPEDKIKLLYVYATAAGEIQPLYSALSGFAKTIRLENPAFDYKILEIQSQTPASLIDQLLGELEVETGEDIHLAYREEKRLVKRFSQLETEDNNKSPDLKKNGVYLITGGAGGLGLIVARHLVKRGNVNLILTGRSELSPEIEAKIEKIKRPGSQIVYIKADISKARKVNELIKEIKSRFKQINGVIHSAGLLRDAFILKKTIEEINAVLAPKVNGTIHLDEATKDENLDFFIVFSSLAAVLGNVGQSDYSYANSFMADYVLMREQLRKETKRTGKSICIDWPLWQEGGMKISREVWEKTENQTGLKAMPTSEGVNALNVALRTHVPQFTVMYGHPPGLIQTMKTGLYQKIERKPEDNININNINDINDIEININPTELSDKTGSYLQKVLAEILKLPPSKLDPAVRFEVYGIDSIIINIFNKKIEKELCKIPKTLLFEYQTLKQLTDYFIKNHRLQLAEFFNLLAGPPEGKPAQKVPDARQNAPGSLREKQILTPRGRVPNWNTRQSTSTNRKGEEETIAVIGISGRYPMAKNLDEYWKNLVNKKDCITEIPLNRWDYRPYYAPEPAGDKIYCKWGGFIDDVDKFEPLLFNISPREADTIDPQERIFLEIAWETLEDAGYNREEISRYIGKDEEAKVGVFAGVTTYTYNLQRPDLNLTPSGPVAWSIANRVSFAFNFFGPSMPVDTACSSSLTALHLACESLKKGECRMALAGGVNLYLHASRYRDLCSVKMLSRTGRCHTFGSQADGFVPGEGVGAVLLKPLSHARRDHDHIYAVIKGSSINHGGRTNGYTVPNPNAQASLITQALENSGIDPRSISYIEAHGTGTSLGDPIEVTGLNKAFRKYTGDKQYCPIGSVKSNIGHLEAAAGIAGLTKIILQMKHKKLAPSLHADTLNPNIDFADSPFYVQHELTQWKNPPVKENGTETKYPRRAAISSFGAGGSNAHIIVEEYRTPESHRSSGNENQLILLSARNEKTLKTYASRLANFLQTTETPPHRTGAEDSHEDSHAIQNFQGELRRMAAGILHTETNDIDGEEDFISSGFDPVTLAILTRQINEKYHLEILPALLSQYPSINALAHDLSRLKPDSETEQDGVIPDMLVPKPSLTDIAYTLQVGREPMSKRLAAVVTGIDELIEKLQQYSQGNTEIEHLFKGDKNTDKKMVECLFKGKSGEEYVKNLIEEQQFEALAQLWASGFNVDWNRMNRRENPRRVSLPTYPFAGETHWLKIRTDSHHPGEEKRFQKRFLHPLIDGINPTQSLDIANGLVFQKKLRPTDRIVSHHQVAGQCILPAVAYLEMAYAALTHVLEYEHSSGHNHNRINLNLTGVMFLQPLTVQNRSTIVQVLIKKNNQKKNNQNNNNRKLQFEIHSNNGDNSIIHARGEAYVNRNEAPGKQQIPVDKIKTAGNGLIHKDTLYNTFQKIGLHYGTYFQGLEQIVLSDTNDTGVLGVLNLPSQYEAGFHESNYTLHPTMMDAALQTIAGHSGDFSTGEIPPRLPFFIEKVEILHPMGEKGYSYVKIADPQQHKYNVAVLDDTGTVCIKLHGVTLRELKPKNTETKSNKFNDPLEHFFYKPGWKSSPHSIPADTRKETLLTRTSGMNPEGKQKILIVYPSSSIGLETALADIHTQLGDEVIQIRLGEKTNGQSGTHRELETSDPTALDHCIAQMDRIDCVYFLGSSDNQNKKITDLEALEKSQEQGVISLFRLVKALIQHGYNRQPLQFKVITGDGQQVFPEEIPAPGGASLYGLTRSMVKEQAKWKALCIDVGLREMIQDEPAQQERNIREAIEAILLDPVDEAGKEIAYRSGQRYRRIIVPINLPPVGEMQSLLKPQGVYLVLGGTGGIGLELSRYLAETLKARLVLVDRNPLNDRQKKTIAQIEAAGGDVLYLQADAANPEEMKAAVSDAITRFGHINGAIHSAIVLKDKILENMDEQTFRAALAPKVRASVVLYNALKEQLKEQPLDFMMFFSSAQSLSCNPGQSNYAAGCTFKDAFAHYLNRVVPYPVKIINWGYWGTVGVVASQEYNKRLADQGVWPIKPREGMEAVKRILTYPVHQISPVKATAQQLETIGNVNGCHIELYPGTIHSLIRSTMDILESTLQKKSSKQEIRHLVQFIKELEKLEQLSNHMLLEAFRQMGAFQQPGEQPGEQPVKQYTREQLREQLNVIPRYHLLFDALLDILVRAELIETRDNQRFSSRNPAERQFTEAFDSTGKSREKKMTEIINNNSPHLTPFIKLLFPCVTALPGILTGRVNHMEVMFPKGSMELVENIYRGNTISDFYNKQVAAALKIYIRERLEKQPDTPIRIMEAGAGTGGTSAIVLDTLQEYKDNIHYIYTDVSLKFIRHGEETFAARYPFAEFTLFDLEKPPLEQGLEPDSIDIIFASNVLHATRNMEHTLKGLKTLQKTNGILIINEVTHTWSFNTLTFGLTDGWWCYEDKENRIEASPVLSPAKWRQVMALTGYRHLRTLGFPGEKENEYKQAIIIGESDGQVEVEDRETTCTTNEEVRQQAERQEIPEPNRHPLETKKRDSKIDRKIEAKPPLNDIVEEMVTGILSTVLHIKDTRLEPDSSFQDYGVDSLLAVEIIDKINEKLETSLRATDLFNFSTIRALIDHVTEEVGKKGGGHLQIQDKQDTKPETDIAPMTREETGEPGLDTQRFEIPGDEFIDNLFDQPEDKRFPSPLQSDPGTDTPTAGEQETAEQETAGKRNTPGEEIAIIGMSCQFPDADDYTQFWENLQAGKDSIRQIPAHRWETETLDNLDNGEIGRWGAFLANPMQFDASFFNITPSEADVMAPQQKLFLQETWRALEDAGYSDRDLHEKKCGIFVGCSSGDFLIKLREKEIKPNTHYLTGNDSAILASRIAYHLNLRGPAIAIDAACSSSLAALHLAIQSLASGTCDIAAAGGVMVYTTPFFHAVAGASGMLSPDNKCKSFDDNANGYVPGEGVGALVLKPLRTALQDRDHIYGLIKGSGMNHNGKTIGITAPSAASQSALQREVYHRYNIHPETITYIEAHGTGTKLGDPIEINALTDTFTTYTDRKQFCAVGSVKTNIGHALAAAGIASIIKVLLAIKHKKIPPSLHYNTPNRHIRFQDTPFFVNTTLKDWETAGPTGLRRAAVSAFSYSGTNVHMVLEEFHPQTENESAKSRPAYFIPVSAKTGDALKQKYLELADWLKENPGCSMTDISYTLHRGRSHFPIRSFLVVNDRDDLNRKLNALNRGENIKNYRLVNLKEFKPGKNPDSVREGNRFIQEIQLQDPRADQLSRDRYIQGLINLAECYVQGIDNQLEWDMFYRDMRCTRLPMPAYPFNRGKNKTPGPNRQAQPFEDNDIKELIEMLAVGAITVSEANILTEGKL